MKKRYLILQSVAVASLALSSCNNSFLERYPIAEISPESSFQSASDLELFTNSFYEALPSITTIVKADNVSDNVLYTAIPTEQRTTDRIVPSSAGSGGWDWEDLRTINTYFKYYENCPDEDARTTYAGVACFFRAWFYLEKLQTFGDVPWYDTVIETGDYDLLYKARDSREYVVEKIIEDLEFAASALGTTRSPYAVSKWTALALLSRVCLFEGTFRKYHTNLNLSGSDELLEMAAYAAGEVMGSGYSIYSTGSSDVDYRNLFCYDDLMESEVILGRQYSTELNVLHNLNYYLTSKTQDDVSLTKDLVDSYLMTSGTPFTSQSGYSTMEFYEEMQDRDPRLAQTIRSLGYTRIDGTTALLPEFEAAMSGYQIAKFVGVSTQDGDGTSSQAISIIRYAEVLLNYAEALAELGTITQDDLDVSIGKIRSRVNMPSLNLTSSNASPDAVLAAQYSNVSGDNKGVILEVRRERRIELALEGFRYNDLMRWRAGKLLEPHFVGMYFPAVGEYDLDNDGTMDVLLYSGTAPSTTASQKIAIGDVMTFTETTSGNIVPFISTTKGFDEDRDYLYPIPSEDILLNPNLEQNLNW